MDRIYLCLFIYVLLFMTSDNLRVESRVIRTQIRNENSKSNDSDNKNNNNSDYKNSDNQL